MHLEANLEKQNIYSTMYVQEGNTYTITLAAGVMNHTVHLKLGPSVDVGNLDVPLFLTSIPAPF